jgi:hypothetical protein
VWYLLRREAFLSQEAEYLLERVLLGDRCGDLLED